MQQSGSFAYKYKEDLIRAYLEVLLLLMHLLPTQKLFNVMISFLVKNLKSM